MNKKELNRSVLLSQELYARNKMKHHPFRHMNATLYMFCMQLQLWFWFNPVTKFIVFLFEEKLNIPFRTEQIFRSSC